MKKIVIISGIIAPKKQGNQSIKNTIKGYLDNGWQVRHFSMISKNNPDYDFSDLQAHKQYKHFGFPHFVMKMLKGKSRKKTAAPTAAVKVDFPGPDQVIDLGTTEVTGRQIMLAKFYRFWETIRTFFYILFNRPSAVYGYEIYGAGTAASISRIYGLPLFTRFQGTYVTDANWDYKPIQYHKKMMSFKNAHVVMANDGTKGDAVLNRLGINSDKVFFWPNGLDAQMLEKKSVDESDIKIMRDRINPDNRKVVFGLFNRYYPFKRIDRALHLVKKFREEGLDVQLVVASGGGPLEASLKQYAKDIGVSEFVSWLGRVPFHEMPVLYKSCDCILVVNDYANTGNQIYEAIINKRPLLATDDSNNSALFADCPYAHFFKPEDFSQLEFEIVSKLIKNSEKDYQSPFLVGWDKRMEIESEWVEQKL